MSEMIRGTLGWSRGAEVTGPTREVHHADALAFLLARPRAPGASLVTSLPDVSELGQPLEAWAAFFAEAAAACLDAVPPEGVAVFFQTDKKVDGRWISKAGALLQVAAAQGVPLVWHKIVCRRPPGTVIPGRPGFSHLLCFSREARAPALPGTPDVLPELGELPWSHSMGRAAAELAVDAVRRLSPATHTVLAPFCGTGLVLDVAMAAGFSAVGIERNRKRADRARAGAPP